MATKKSKPEVAPNPALDPVKGAFENCAWFQFMHEKDGFSAEFEEAWKHRDAINKLIAERTDPLWVVPKLRSPVLVRRPTRGESDAFRDENAEIFGNDNLPAKQRAQMWRAKCLLFSRSHIVYPDRAAVESLCQTNYFFDDAVIEVLTQIMGDEWRADSLKLVKP